MGLSDCMWSRTSLPKIRYSARKWAWKENRSSRIWKGLFLLSLFISEYLSLETDVILQTQTEVRSLTSRYMEYHCCLVSVCFHIILATTTLFQSWTTTWKIMYFLLCAKKTNGLFIDHSLHNGWSCASPVGLVTLGKGNEGGSSAGHAEVLEMIQCCPFIPCWFWIPPWMRRSLWLI